MIRFLLIFLIPNVLHAASYSRAIEDKENVRHKLFPKEGRLELSLPSFGMILNQSYIDSFVLHGSLSYYFTESFGLSLEGAVVINSDKTERFCIEHFYNDPEERVSVPCPEEGTDLDGPLYDENDSPIKGANFGPAYVNIRELETLAFITASWNPIYGKQLAFLSFTSYFDIFATAGVGVALSKFYPESQFLKNGTLSRGPLPDDFEGGCPSSPGICPDPDDPTEVDNNIGEKGRPDPSSETSPAITLGIGQKFHFYKRFHIKAEIRNFTLMGTSLGIEPFYALWLGAGVRF